MSIVCERSFLNLASDLGIRCAFSFKMADHKYKKDIKKLGYPVIVKPATLGSSVGITYVKKEEDIDYVIERMPAIMDKLTSISPFQDELEELRKRRG